MSEYCILDGPEGKGGNGRDLGINTALDVARVIHLDLTEMSVTAWQWWTAFSPEDYKDGLLYTDWKKPGDKETVLTSKMFWALGHYSRFVRPGMRRVALNGQAHDIRGLMGSAYVDPKTGSIVAVYLNMSAEPQRLNLSFNAPVAQIVPYTTDATGDMVPGQSLTQVTDYRIPARSIVTFTVKPGASK